MSYILEVRNKLNCSAREFADFLGISRQILSKVERSNGVLPGFTNDCIEALGKGIMDVDNATEGMPVNTEEEDIKSFVEQRNALIQLSLVTLRRELEKMQEHFTTAMQAKRYYEKALLYSEKLDQKSIGWLKSQATLQTNIMSKNDRWSRHTLQVKIAQLELELEMNNAK